MTKEKDEKEQKDAIVQVPCIKHETTVHGLAGNPKRKDFLNYMNRKRGRG